MENLNHLYADLILELAQNRSNYSESELTIFSASSGIDYNGRVMVVGRAVNGWKHYLDPSSQESITNCMASVHNALKTENLNWVKLQWGSRDKYNTKKSAFWRLAKAISAETNPNSKFQTDSIVWTNLYKASKEEGGNPSGRLMNIQFQLCKQILDAEIAYYKPSYIIFLTGLSWARPFLAAATQIEVNPSWNYVEQVGIYQSCKYVVGQHPQGKNEAFHLKEIVDHII